jgi:hypothetical protein
MHRRAADVIADEEERAALWRQQQLQLLSQRVALFRALAAPPEPYARVREAWRPVELWLVETKTDTPTPLETLEDSDDRRNPYGCLIP